MKYLQDKFRMNGLPYTLLKRNDFVVLYGIGGTYTDRIILYEVSKIYVRIDKYGVREAIPCNERFGRDKSRCFNDLELALEYFEELTAMLKFTHQRHLALLGVEENVETIPEHLS